MRNEHDANEALAASSRHTRHNKPPSPKTYEPANSWLVAVVQALCTIALVGLPFVLYFF